MPLYSHSRLSCYETCPFQYKLKYVDRVKSTLGTTIEAFVGSMVHDALEWLYGCGNGSSHGGDGLRRQDGSQPFAGLQPQMERNP